MRIWIYPLWPWVVWQIIKGVSVIVFVMVMVISVSHGQLAPLPLWLAGAPGACVLVQITGFLILAIMSFRRRLAR